MYFTFSSVSIVDFEQVNVSWVCGTYKFCHKVFTFISGKKVKELRTGLKVTAHLNSKEKIFWQSF